MSGLAIAAVLAGSILLAGMFSVELGLSVAIFELVAGFVAGNAFTIAAPDWLTFLAMFAGVVLAFLAGAEVDTPLLRREWRPSFSIGAVSFGAPFLVVGLLAYYGLGWNHRQAEIAGITLSETSLAVVYALLVETGLNQTVTGKRLMSATFATNLGTVIALTVLFVEPGLWIVPFALVSVALIAGLPRLAPWFFSRYGDRVTEPEIKLVFAALFLLMWLGYRAHSQAVLPAFVLGLVMSGHYAQHRAEQHRMRVVTFAFLTPFFFFKSGMSISASALWANLGIAALLFAGKVGPKLAGVHPLARRYCAPHETFTTLLMSTGLTFGAIAALYGLDAGIIDTTQFSVLIGAVVLSAIAPTAIAQQFFQPEAHGHHPGPVEVDARP